MKVWSSRPRAVPGWPPVPNTERFSWAYFRFNSDNDRVRTLIRRRQRDSDRRDFLRERVAKAKKLKAKKLEAFKRHRRRAWSWVY